MKIPNGRTHKDDRLQRTLWGSGSATRLGSRTTGWTVIHEGKDIGEIIKHPNGTWMARPLSNVRPIVIGTEYRYRNDAERAVRDYHRTYPDPHAN